MALVAGAATRLGGPGSAAAGLPSHSRLLRHRLDHRLRLRRARGAGAALSRPPKERSIHLYLVRPLTGTDYIVSRWAAFLAVMVAAAWLPQLILFIGLVDGRSGPGSHISRTHWLDVPRFLLAGLAMAVYATTLAMLTASFTTRRAYASVFLVGLFVITTPFTVGPGAGDAAARPASGSRCSTSPTSRST